VRPNAQDSKIEAIPASFHQASWQTWIASFRLRAFRRDRSQNLRAAFRLEIAKTGGAARIDLHSPAVFF
jgi:hypothetical protein